MDPSRRVRLAEALVGLVAAATVLGGFVARWSGRVFLGSTWTDRDLLRAAALPQAWPTSAAELSFGTGARVPGGLLYVLLAIPQASSDRVLDAFRFQTALVLLGTLLVAATAHRLGGWVAAAVAAVVCATAPASTTATDVLWNPGLLPLFVAIGTAGIVEGARTRDGRWLGLVALGFGLGAQLHLSAWLGLLAAVAAHLAPGTARRERGLLGAAAVLLLAFAPYLLDEAAHGWPNTRMLLVGHHSSLLEGSVALPHLAVLPRVLGLLAVPGFEGADPLGIVSALGLGAAAVAALVDVGRRGPHARALGALLALVGVTVAFFVAEGRVELVTVVGRERYFTVAVPAAAVLLGTGAARAVAATGRRALATLAVAGVLVSTGVLARRVDDEVAGSPHAAWRLDGALDDVARLTGWTLPEIAGRTLGAVRHGGRVEALPELPMTWRLASQGLPPPRAVAPPCAVLLFDEGRGGVVDEAAVDRAYGRVLPGRALRDVLDLPHGGAKLAVVDTTDRLCPTNTAQPYVPEAAEAGIVGSDDRRRGGEPEEQPVGIPGLRRQIAALDLPTARMPTTLVLATDVDTRACPAVLSLTSPRLRGVAWNLGQLQPAALEDAVLELRGEGGVHEVSLGIFRLGSYGVPTPVAVALPPVAGTFDVALRAQAREAHVDEVDDGPTAAVSGTIFRGATLPGCAVAGRDPDRGAP